jgi:hypothetical protein
MVLKLFRCEHRVLVNSNAFDREFKLERNRDSNSSHKTSILGLKFVEFFSILCHNKMTLKM